MADKPYYTIEEAASLLGVCAKTVRIMCVEDRIDGLIMVGSTYAIPRGWVESKMIPKGFVSAADASRMTGISRESIRKAVATGKLDSIRVPRSREKCFIFVNAENAKWREWLTLAQERSTIRKKP